MLMLENKMQYSTIRFSKITRMIRHNLYIKGRLTYRVGHRDHASCHGSSLLSSAFLRVSVEYSGRPSIKPASYSIANSNISYTSVKSKTKISHTFTKAKL